MCLFITKKRPSSVPAWNIFFLRDFFTRANELSLSIKKNHHQNQRNVRCCFSIDDECVSIRARFRSLFALFLFAFYYIMTIKENTRARAFFNERREINLEENYEFFKGGCCVLFFSVFLLFFCCFFGRKRNTFEIFFFSLSTFAPKSCHSSDLCFKIINTYFYKIQFTHEPPQGANRIIIIIITTTTTTCSRRSVIIGIHRTRFFRRLWA